MTKRAQQLAIFLSILVIHGRVLLAQQTPMSGRFYQQQMNYMNRHMACEDDLVGTPRAPERPNATFGVVSDDFALAAKPILEAVIQLRQYPQIDDRFYDLADQINTMLLPMPEAVHYFPDAITCGFLSELYGWVVEFKAQDYRDKSVRLAEAHRVDICTPLLHTILDSKNLLSSQSKFVYAPCADATKQLTLAIKESKGRRPRPTSH